MSTSDPLTLAHELVAKKAARDRGDTVVSFDTPAVRRGGLEMSDLAKSPLISGFILIYLFFKTVGYNSLFCNRRPR